MKNLSLEAWYKNGLFVPKSKIKKGTLAANLQNIEFKTDDGEVLLQFPIGKVLKIVNEWGRVRLITSAKSMGLLERGGVYYIYLYYPKNGLINARSRDIYYGKVANKSASLNQYARSAGIDYKELFGSSSFEKYIVFLIVFVLFLVLISAIINTFSY